MNIDSVVREGASEKFRELTALSFDLDTSDISFSYIDINKKSVMAVTTNYEWHLNYWDKNLDTQLSQRLVPCIINWKKYDSVHQSTLKACMPNRNNKIDICTRHNNIFELMSFSTDCCLEFSDIGNLLMIKPKISMLVYKNFNKLRDDITLPLRGSTCDNFTFPSGYKPFFGIDTCKFGETVLTDLEMDTIRQLLACRSVKEIATRHYCSEKVERKRVDNIKRKMECDNLPLSRLFDKLKKYGIVEACLDPDSIYR